MFSLRALWWMKIAVLTPLLLMPFFTSAQIPTIVPDDCRGAGAAANCDFCDLAELAQNTLNAGIYVAVFLSAILFAWAGWKYVSAGGDPGKAKAGKEIFTNVVIGLVIILVGWLVVDTIMKTFVNESATFGPWNDVC